MTWLWLLACTQTATFETDGAALLTIPTGTAACEATGLPGDCAPRLDAASGTLAISVVTKDAKGDTVPAAYDGDDLHVLLAGARMGDVDVEGRDLETGKHRTVWVVGPGMPDAGRAGLTRSAAALSASDHDIVVLPIGGEPSAPLASPAALAKALDEIPTERPESIDGYGALVAGLRALEKDLDDGVVPSLWFVDSGFSGSTPDARCSDNVATLARAIDAIGAAKTRHPKLTVNTIGFGRPYRKADPPEGSLSVASLCGTYGAEPVARLQEGGVDHVSMAWLAHAGGGQTYIRHTQGGVEDASALLAAPRARWHAVTVTAPDPAVLSGDFDLDVRLATDPATTGTLRVRWQ